MSIGLLLRGYYGNNNGVELFQLIYRIFLTMNTVRKILIGILAAADGPRRGGGPLFTARYASALVWRKKSWLFQNCLVNESKRTKKNECILRSVILGKVFQCEEDDSDDSPDKISWETDGTAVTAVTASTAAFFSNFYLRPLHSFGTSLAVKIFFKNL